MRILRWVQQFLEQAWVQLLVVIAFSIIAARWAAVRPMIAGWGWPLTVFVFVLVVGVSLFTFAQLRQTLDQMRQQRLRSASAEILAETIREWLYSNRFAVANSAQPNATFSLDVTDPPGRGYTVLQPKDRGGTVVVGTTMTIKPEEYTLIDGLPFTIIRESRIELARLGLDWRGLGHPLREVTIVASLSVSEQLTEARLLEAIRRVRSGSILLTELMAGAVERSVANPPQPEQ